MHSRDIGFSLDLGLGASLNGGPKTREGKQVETQNSVVAGLGIGDASGFGNIRNRIGDRVKKIGGWHCLELESILG